MDIGGVGVGVDRGLGQGRILCCNLGFGSQQINMLIKNVLIPPAQLQSELLCFSWL